MGFRVEISYKDSGGAESIFATSDKCQGYGIMIRVVKHSCLAKLSEPP